MTLTDAFHKNISRVRKTVWINPYAYLRQDILKHESANERFCGPWCHLFDRKTQELIGEPTPQSILAMYCEADDWEIYTGPIDENDKGV